MRMAWCSHSYHARFRTATRAMATSRMVAGRVVRVRMARRKEFLAEVYVSKDSKENWHAVRSTGLEITRYHEGYIILELFTTR